MRVLLLYRCLNKLVSSLVDLVHIYQTKGVHLDIMYTSNTVLHVRPEAYNVHLNINFVENLKKWTSDVFTLNAAAVHLIIDLFHLFIYFVAADYIHENKSSFDRNGPPTHDDTTERRQSVSPSLGRSSPESISSLSSGPEASSESGYGSRPSPPQEIQPEKKKARASYRPDQIKVLERQFQDNPYPDAERIETLSADLGIPENKLRVSSCNIK